MTSGTSLSASHTYPRRGAFIFALLSALCLVLAACGGPANNTTPATAKKHVLTIGTQTNPITKQGFNLYSSINNAGIYDLAGFVNETLGYVNPNDNSFTPLLATSYDWNSDSTQLTFHLRQGVKWNDGQAFTSGDVMFTFNDLKQYKAADLNGDWNYLSNVTAPDDNTVVMTFQKPYVPAFYYIASETPIIPQHVYASVGDPTKYINDKPVGTGPFTVTRYTTDLVVFDKNPGYWNASKIAVDEIRMPYIKDNQTAELEMAKGQIDWGGYFLSDLQKTYVDKDPAHNKYWMDATDEFGLFPNLTNPLLANVAVRQAINAALDRTALSNEGEAGLAPPVNATGLVLPAAQPFLDPNYANLSNSPDVAKAQKYLTDAGFVKGSDGIFADKSGHRLSFVIRSVQGYTDWNQMAQIMQDNLKAVGIEISKIDQVDPNNYYNIRGDDKFDLEIAGLLGGPTPFYIYYAGLYSKFIGSNSGNYARWNNPQTDQLLQQFASTSDPNMQKQVIGQLEKLFVEQLPWIPIIAAPRWAEYTTVHFTGWPDADHRFATASPYQAPDNEIIVSHLIPAA